MVQETFVIASFILGFSVDRCRFWRTQNVLSLTLKATWSAWWLQLHEMSRQHSQADVFRRRGPHQRVAFELLHFQRRQVNASKPTSTIQRIAPETVWIRQTSHAPHQTQKQTTIASHSYRTGLPQDKADSYVGNQAFGQALQQRSKGLFTKAKLRRDQRTKLKQRFFQQQLVLQHLAQDESEIKEQDFSKAEKTSTWQSKSRPTTQPGTRNSWPHRFNQLNTREIQDHQKVF